MVSDREGAGAASKVAILNSSVILSGLREVARSYGGGTVKAEPKELGRFLVLDPCKLSPEDRSALAEEFRASAGETPEEFSAARKRIDEILKSA